jgi:hypothetical protein
VFRFQPDAVLYVTNRHDEDMMLGQLANVLASGSEYPYEIIRDIAASAQITPDLPAAVIEAKLQPLSNELYVAAIRQLVSTCRDHGSRPILVFRPSPTADRGIERQQEREMLARLTGIASEVRVPLFDLSAAFENCAASELTVSLWDDHAGSRGQQLLADELYRQMSSPEGLQAWQARKPRTDAAIRPASFSGN